MQETCGQFEEKYIIYYYINILFLSENLNVSAKFGDAAEACNQLIILMSFFLMFVTFPFSLLFAIKWTQVEKCYKELFSLLLTYIFKICHKNPTEIFPYVNFELSIHTRGDMY